MSRHGVRHAAGAARSGAAESGAFSTRNAVVAVPARTTGCATSQRRKGKVRRDALDLGLRERGGEPLQRLVAVSPVRDQLRDHRVVREPDLVALLDARVDANAEGTLATDCCEPV